MRKVIILSVILFIILSGCKSPNSDMDAFINKMQNKDFNIFKGLSVHYRSRGEKATSFIYFVNTDKAECSPYVVEVANHS